MDSVRLGRGFCIFRLPIHNQKGADFSIFGGAGWLLCHKSFCLMQPENIPSFHLAYTGLLHIRQTR